MTKKLVSIIIPYHNETEKTLKIVLSSINNQIGIDLNRIEVVLVCDAGNRLDNPDNFLSWFENVDIKYYELTLSGGPGVARQYGMDHSDSEYIMFMDADDQLQYCGALFEFFNVVQQTGNHQIIACDAMEQFKNSDNQFRYRIRSYQDNKIFAWGKWFNRSYLDSIQLTWHPKLRIFEDTYFVGTACLLATDIFHHQVVVYMWLWNSNSITRNTGKFFAQSLDTWVELIRYRYRILSLNNLEIANDDFCGMLTAMAVRETKNKPNNQAKYNSQLRRTLNECVQAYELNYEKLVKKIIEAMKNDDFLKNKPIWELQKLAQNFVKQCDKLMENKKY